MIEDDFGPFAGSNQDQIKEKKRDGLEEILIDKCGEGDIDFNIVTRSGEQKIFYFYYFLLFLLYFLFILFFNF